ncbi:hypothetical protein [Aliarcobacter butzleri]|uniref:hypothetical protein n=1 Tax=Aliarcobacter butzleri TaxID=28197 RepID=UPI003BB17260
MATRKSIIPEFMKDNSDDIFQQLFFITKINNLMILILVILLINISYGIIQLPYYKY